MRKQEGITLIALVITIIVLLILAGVTIAMLTGENGLLTRAKAAGPAQEVAAAKEEVGLIFNDAMAEYYDQKYVKSNGSADLETIFIAMANGTGDYSTYAGKLTEAKKHNCSVSVTTSGVSISYPSSGTAEATATATISGTTINWQ